MQQTTASRSVAVIATRNIRAHPRFVDWLWVPPALTLGMAAGATTFRDGVAHLGNYLQYTVGFSLPLAWGVAVGVVCMQSAAAVTLLWQPTRRIGWVLTGGFGAACAPFHAIAFATGDARACPCLGIELIAGGVLAHLVLGAVCAALFGIALIGAYAYSGTVHRSGNSR